VIIAALAPVVGPWHFDVGTVRMISVSTAKKPLTAGLWFAVAALLFTSRLERAWAAQSAFAFYVIAAIAMYVLALGPEPALFGTSFWYWPPYAWLLEVPGFSNVRVPGRFAMLATLCLAVAAAIAFERVRQRLPPSRTVAFTALALAAVCADGWIRSFPVVDLPPRTTLSGVPHDGVVVELPLGGVAGDVAAMYRSIYTGHPVVNGYSGFDPVHYQILRGALEARDVDALAALATARPIAVVEADHTTTLLPAAAHEYPPYGSVLPVQSVAVDGQPIDLSVISDGDISSRWTTGVPQQGTETLTIDLGTTHEVSGLVMNLGVYRNDYPRSLQIETSDDRLTWTTMWSGRCAGKAVSAALRNPARVPLSFTFAPSAARWLRLRQLDRDRAYWSIADLTIYGR